MDKLNHIANDDFGKSNVAFLRGFNERMRGNVHDAEGYFLEAYGLSKGDYSSARELASICLMRGNLDDAEKFAREARVPSRRNDFIVDILLSVLIKKRGRRAPADPEILELLDLLEASDKESGRSFYNTRKAELEHYYGDNRRAKVLIEEAIKATPYIFEPRRICAEILLKDKETGSAAVVLKWMRDRVNARDVGERRTNYRLYLETEAHYLTEVGSFDDAKAIYANRSVFSDREAQKGIKEVEIAQGFRQQRR